ncbi:hypothetical protein [Oceaniglobus ichthyenteri]|uniref:hypothetical protein n=1 Tax=Oceaniglobus ichthyenteri TaxID=2136177 RepID=UPI000D38EC00|nr:hypothetical protein [Oceaniglobus ichthyenteri]
MNTQHKVAMLRPIEPVSIDPACLALLRDTNSANQADNNVAEALEDVALGLSRIAGAYRQDRFDDIKTEGIAIGEIAGRIGLERMARVAFTVATLAKGSDGVALSANLARLVRLGNDALSEIWDLQDQIV